MSAVGDSSRYRATRNRASDVSFRRFPFFCLFFLWYLSYSFLPFRSALAFSSEKEKPLARRGPIFRRRLRRRRRRRRIVSSPAFSSVAGYRRESALLFPPDASLCWSQRLPLSSRGGVKPNEFFVCACVCVGGGGGARRSDRWRRALRVGSSRPRTPSRARGLPRSEAERLGAGV